MKVVRVEISRDDGSTISLEGDTATEWDEQVKAACQSAWIHGMRFETLPWRVSTDSVGVVDDDIASMNEEQLRRKVAEQRRYIGILVECGKQQLKAQEARRTETPKVKP